MTELLYLADPYLTRFSATIVERLTDQDKYGVILDRTAFYPTSGGQLHDTGTINGITVYSLDIIEDDVIHWIGSPIESDQIEGVVDWERRFDHMQQHTGQHILSAAFENISNAATVGFHMSDDYCTIDLDINRVDSNLVQRIEDLVNEVVTDNKPVTTKTVIRNESEPHALRKPPPDHPVLRLVEVEGFDICACGGTHVNRTGEIGLIKITSTENRPGNKVRIEFLCGSRAIKDYRFKHQLMTDLGVAFTTSIEDVPQSVEKLRGQIKQLRKQNQSQLQRLAEFEASHMISSALNTEKGKVVSAVLTDELAEHAGTISNSITKRGEMIVLLGINAAKPRLMFARSEKVDLSVSDLLRLVLSKYDGWSGGGRPHLAQGGGPKGQGDSLKPILAEALEEITRFT